MLQLWEVVKLKIDAGITKRHKGKNIYEIRSCFICGKPGHTAIKWRNKKHSEDKAATMLALSEALLASHKGKKLDK